jgi:hypothetical protein
VSIGNKQPTIDKLMEQNGIILLYFMGLSGCGYILGKKRALLLISEYDNETGYIK